MSDFRRNIIRGILGSSPAQVNLWQMDLTKISFLFPGFAANSARVVDGKFYITNNSGVSAARCQRFRQTAEQLGLVNGHRYRCEWYISYANIVGGLYYNINGQQTYYNTIPNVVEWTQTDNNFVDIGVQCTFTEYSIGTEIYITVNLYEI